MSGVVTILAAGLYLLGAVEVFRARRTARRLRGLVLLAAGGLALTLWSGPAVGPAILVVTVSALTLVGLLVFARALERRGREQRGTDLDLDRDPLRWP